jgi:hypothetical protein
MTIKEMTIKEIAKSINNRELEEINSLLNELTTGSKLRLRDILIACCLDINQPIYFDSEIICTHSMFDECYYHNEILKEECN